MPQPLTVHSPPETRGSLILAWLLVAAAIAAAACCLLLMISGYVKCPYLDGWWTIAQIAGGESPRSLRWLWSQQNEHRIYFSRLAIWADLFAFGGRNLFLFSLTIFTQVGHFLLWAFAVRRWSGVSKPVQLTIAGIFGYCLFCPSQVENFVWAFQFSFLLPFALATLAFVLTLLASETKWRGASLAAAAVAPLVAMGCLAGGLVIWPFLPLAAFLARLGKRAIAGLALLGAAAIGVYLIGYTTPAYHSHPAATIHNPFPLFRYVLTYFGTSWWFLLPHLARTIALFGVAGVVWAAVACLRRRGTATKFQLLLVLESLFLLAVSVVTALGRVTLGIGQASSSRYQTPAMLFWACAASFAVLWCASRRSRRPIFILQSAIVVICLLSSFAMPSTYAANRARQASMAEACDALAAGDDNPELTKRLLDHPDVIGKAATLLRSIWSKPAPTRN